MNSMMIVVPMTLPMRPMPALPGAYEQLELRHARLGRFDHLGAMLDWDRLVNLPVGSSVSRAAALAELESLIHGLRSDPALGDLMDRAEQESLDAGQRANLREMRRQWCLGQALPADLVETRAHATVACEQAWRRLRPVGGRQGDWDSYLPLWQEVVRIARIEAHCLSDALGLPPYDALMQRFEPGMTSAELGRIFDELRGWLPGLIRRVRQHQAGWVADPAEPGDINREAQIRLHRDVMGWLGFDFERGRLDESAHPCTCGVPDDVRLTTRLSPERVIDNLLATIHETGHALYEQHLPARWRGQPVGRARSMAIHESQSLLFEMMLARHPAVIEQLSQRLTAHLGTHPAWSAPALQRRLLRLRSGLIRTEADEVSYPAHVMLRFEIERDLIEARIEPADVPALWDEKLTRYLDADPKAHPGSGPMQDVHWSEGLFGYFPCYAMGAIAAAQWMAAMRREFALDEALAAGDLAPLRLWLDRSIWSRACLVGTPDLLHQASGTGFDTRHYKSHLQDRYL
jgi:carboxypeptidase Taq